MTNAREHASRPGLGRHGRTTPRRRAGSAGTRVLGARTPVVCGRETVVCLLPIKHQERADGHPSSHPGCAECVTRIITVTISCLVQAYGGSHTRLWGGQLLFSFLA